MHLVVDEMVLFDIIVTCAFYTYTHLPYSLLEQQSQLLPEKEIWRFVLSDSYWSIVRWLATIELTELTVG